MRVKENRRSSGVENEGFRGLGSGDLPHNYSAQFLGDHPFDIFQGDLLSE